LINYGRNYVIVKINWKTVQVITCNIFRVLRVIPWSLFHWFLPNIVILCRNYILFWNKLLFYLYIKEYKRLFSIKMINHLPNKLVHSDSYNIAIWLVDLADNVIAMIRVDNQSYYSYQLLNLFTSSFDDLCYTSWTLKIRFI